MVGGAYLIYLGIHGLRAQPRVVDDIVFATGAVKHRSNISALVIRRGFFCNVLNPKAPVYFVTLFTLVLSPDIPLWQLSVYGMWMMVLQMAWFSTVVMLLSLPVVNRRFQRSAHWVDRVLGGAMVILGINVILRRG
ncbi:LysE family transporter [Cardiobacteriaceae bacterium TAE3-ERU3]|nr:LysE family transporter [Cardiobacteriaceae bacterium TAE3-ERU3]